MDRSQGARELRRCSPWAGGVATARRRHVTSGRSCPRAEHSRTPGARCGLRLCHTRFRSSRSICRRDRGALRETGDDWEGDSGRRGATLRTVAPGSPSGGDHRTPAWTPRRFGGRGAAAWDATWSAAAQVRIAPLPPGAGQGGWQEQLACFLSLSPRKRRKKFSARIGNVFAGGVLKKDWGGMQKVVQSIRRADLNPGPRSGAELELPD